MRFGLASSLIVAALLFLAGCQSAGSQASGPSSQVIKVYSETFYEVKFTKFWGGEAWDQVSTLSTGTAFTVQLDGHVYIVTAAHVVGGARNPTRVGGVSCWYDQWKQANYDISDKCQLQKILSRVRLSHLAIQPVRIVADFDRDLALIEVAPDSLAPLRLEPIPLKGDRPARATQVKAWGFPGTSSEQPAKRMIAASDAGIVTLDDRLEPGFSGGPVLDDAGNLVGLVSHTTDKQARCVSVEVVAEFVRRSRSRMQPYEDKMNLASP